MELFGVQLVGIKVSTTNYTLNLHCFCVEKGCPRIVSALTVMVPGVDAQSSIVQVIKDMIVSRLIFKALFHMS